MSTVKQLQAKRPKMADRARQQMEKHFPDYEREPLWHRKTNDGYSSIPRTLPIAMQAIDALSKGNPGGHTLFCLWARAPDHPLLVIESPTTFAAEAGFIGQRASDTWRRRMKRLRELGFIRTKKGTSGEFHYVLLLNPNIVLAELKKQKKLQEHLADRFEDRLADIGALRDINEFQKKLERLREEAGDNESGKGTKPGTGTPKKKKSRHQKPGARQEAN
ncbi:hypothetical protein CQ393_03550 [Stenotrophomonas sp. MYb238]|uniref:hypothetical protein n=1 Tax=Stenotrophomonas sp. MYb238 TaxID=2040281 RepID=UPI001290D8E8|nr:hypothetical protein [Stenotrophomonas sp. MYb238]MQP74969.1 hypothetical protein [Stenotrophomonas sp. MYb238]